MTMAMHVEQYLGELRKDSRMYDCIAPTKKINVPTDVEGAKLVKDMIQTKCL